MAIGDVDGEGLNEIVTIDTKTLRIYRKKGQEIRLAYPSCWESGKILTWRLILPTSRQRFKEIFVTCSREKYSILCAGIRSER